jgi:alpha-tubulin suppressor-like RCC1 family protein
VTPRAVACFLALAAVSALASGCRRNKPPRLDRVWLGEAQGCGVVKGAPKSEHGGVVCWGVNAGGQLGDGPEETRLIAKPSPFANDATSVVFGAQHACVLLAGGRVTCRGASAAAEAPRSVDAGVTALATGRSHACAVTGGRVICWGDQPPVFAELRARTVAIEDARTCAAVLEPSREVRCLDATGEVRVLAGADVVQLVAGPSHTCALLADTSVRCWGKNDAGQLGDATSHDAKEPVAVYGMKGAVELGAGTRHTCARLSSSTVSCWGDNRFHQLANGTTEPSRTPVPLHGLVGVTEIAAGGDSTCARLADGDVRCWGRNDRGQLGDGTLREHAVPMPVKTR